MTEPRRDQHGRYLIVNGNGPAKPYDRVTTISGSIDDRSNLERWQQRQLITGLANSPALIKATKAATSSAELDRLVKDAHDKAGTWDKANLGTAIHAATELADHGHQPPEEHAAHCALYQATLKEHGIRIHKQWIEKIVVLDDHHVAGTLDRIVTLPNGMNMIADLKTGENLHFSWNSIAVQLAIYAHADAIYNPDTLIRSEMPPVSRTEALVIHLPANGNTCTLHTVDIAAGWEAAQLALDVRQWRHRKDLARPYRAPADTNMIRAERLKERIKQLPDPARHGLAIIWPPNIPTFKQTDGHTTEQLDRIEQAITAIETSYETDF